MDDIIVLDHNGHISARGTLDSLVGSDSYIRGIMQSHRSNESQVTDSVERKGGEVPVPSDKNTVATKKIIKTETTGSQGLEENLPQVTQSNALRYYVSLMGKGNLLAFSSLVLLHIACNTAQRESTSHSPDHASYFTNHFHA